MWVPSALTLTALFAAGIAASPHCGLMCGPLQAAQLRARGSLSLPQALLLLHAGRLSGYALLGATAGAFGAQLLLLLNHAGFGSLVRLLPALAMVAAGIACLRHPHKHCQIKPRPALGGTPASLHMLALGLVWALLPCSLLYGLLFLASAAGGPLDGALLMLAFGLGTTPLLTAAGGALARFQRLAQPHLRWISACLLLGLGLASVAQLLLLQTDANFVRCIGALVPGPGAAAST